MSGQSERLLAGAANQLFESSRSLESVAEKLESVVETMGSAMDRLIDMLDKNGKSGGLGGVGGIGSGLKDAGQGLGEIAKALIPLSKGLSMFGKTKGKKDFIDFMGDLYSIILKQKTVLKDSGGSISEGYEDMSGGFRYLGEGITSLAKGLMWFMFVPQKAVDKTLDVMVKVSDTFSKIDSKKTAKGASAVSDVAKAIGMLGLTLALATPLFVIGAIGSILIIPMLALYAYTFSVIGESGKEIKKGAEGILEMGLALASFALGLFVVKQLAGGDWGEYAEGTMIAILGISAFAAVFYFVGKFAGEVKQGAESLILAGLSIASIAVGIWVFQKLEIGVGSVLVAGLAVAVMGLAFGLVGGLAGEIALGSLALIVSAITLWALAKGIQNFATIKQEDIGVALESVVAVGLAMAGAGALALFIGLGAATMIGASFALTSIAKGLTAFKSVKFTDEDSNKIYKTLGSLSAAFSLAGGTGGTSTFLGITVGANNVERGIESVLDSGKALENISKGLLAFQKLKLSPDENEKLWNSIAYVITGISSTFSVMGGDPGQRGGLLGLIGIEKPTATERGISSVMDAGDALKSITTGLQEFQKLKLSPQENKTLWDNIAYVIAGVSSAFSVMGGDPGDRGGLLGLIGIEKPTNTERGISAVKDVGSTLVDLAQGIKEFANLTFTDPLTGKKVQMTAADIEKAAMNASMVITAVSAAFADAGKSKPSGGLMGLLGLTDSDVENGVKAVSGVGKELVSLAEGVKNFAGLNFKDADGKTVSIPAADLVFDPADPTKSGKIMRNIINVVTAVSTIFGSIGSAKGEATGFWGMFGAKSNTVAEGIEAVKGVGTELKNIADSLNAFGNIKNIDALENNIRRILKVIPEAMIYSATIMEKAGLKKSPTGEISNTFGKFLTKMAESADPITKLATSLDSISKSMGKFASTFKTMNLSSVKTFDNMISSLVTFSKVDPKAFEVLGTRAQQLYTFVYEKAPAKQAAATQPAPAAPVKTDFPGSTPVPAAKPSTSANDKLSQQQHQQMVEMFNAMNDTMSSLAGAMKRIEAILSGTLKVQAQ